VSSHQLPMWLAVESAALARLQLLTSSHGCRCSAQLGL